MKKRWFASMLIARVMTMGIVGGAALANSHGADGELRQSGLMARVAEILGLDQTQVEEVFEQAKGEMRDEAVQNGLDNLVESGELTQAEADEYKAWYDSRPEGVSPGPGTGVSADAALAGPGAKLPDSSRPPQRRPLPPLSEPPLCDRYDIEDVKGRGSAPSLYIWAAAPLRRAGYGRMMGLTGGGAERPLGGGLGG